MDDKLAAATLSRLPDPNSLTVIDLSPISTPGREDRPSPERRRSPSTAVGSGTGRSRAGSPRRVSRDPPAASPPVAERRGPEPNDRESPPAAEDAAERDTFQERMSRMHPDVAQMAAVIGVPLLKRRGSCPSVSARGATDHSAALRRGGEAHDIDDAVRPYGVHGVRVPPQVMVSEDRDADAGRWSAQISEISRIAKQTGDPRVHDLCVRVNRHSDACRSSATIRKIHMKRTDN